MTAIDLGTDTKPIKKLIASFFVAINAANTKALQALFYPSASLTIIRQDPPLPKPSPPPPTADNKLTVVTRTDIETFIKAVEEAERKRKREGHSGPTLVETPDLEATRVEIDGGFAMAWSPFEVTFDGELHHYGTMVYTLGRQQEGYWNIEVLTQSYRRTPGWD